MEKLELAGWSVNRVGLSMIGLKVTGMWGEPSGRSPAIKMIRRAVELGAQAIEVPFPFGPWADLLREADPEGVVAIVRLTGPIREPGAATQRLGARIPVAVVLAEPHLLEDATALGMAPLGVVAGPTAVPSTFREAGVVAVRGPYPPARRIFDWCQAHEVPYLAPSADILAAGPRTMALIAPQSPNEVDRLFGPALTPPAAGPG